MRRLAVGLFASPLLRNCASSSSSSSASGAPGAGDVSSMFAFPSDENGARLLVREVYQGLTSSVHQFGSTKEERASRLNYAVRVGLHYRRTNPSFFDHPAELFVLKLAAASSQTDVFKTVQEMEAKGLAVEAPHYSTAMMAMTLSDDPLCHKTATDLFLHARQSGKDDAALWSDLFFSLRQSKVTPTEFDVWWGCVETAVMDDSKANEVLPERDLSTSGYLHALVWCSAQEDVERALKVWKVMQVALGERGERLPVAAYVEVLRAAARMKHDGGLREAVLGQLKTQVSNQQLGSMRWAEVNALLQCVSPEAALGLVQRFSHGNHNQVPVLIWLTLLRRLAQIPRVAEAEALFSFISHHFQWTPKTKSMAVTTMMGMYSRLRPSPDLDNTLAWFEAHVSSTPDGDPAIPPSRVHYYLMLRASCRCPATTSALFLQAASEGISIDQSMYQTILSNGTTQKQLEKYLPSDRFENPTALDSLLRVPEDADAHAERDRVQKQFGQEVYSSM